MPRLGPRRATEPPLPDCPGPPPQYAVALAHPKPEQYPLAVSRPTCLGRPTFIVICYLLNLSCRIWFSILRNKCHLNDWNFPFLWQCLPKYDSLYWPDGSPRPYDAPPDFFRYPPTDSASVRDGATVAPPTQQVPPGGASELRPTGSERLKATCSYDNRGYVSGPEGQKVVNTREMSENTDRRQDEGGLSPSAPVPLPSDVQPAASHCWGTTSQDQPGQAKVNQSKPRSTRASQGQPEQAKVNQSKPRSTRASYQMTETCVFNERSKVKTLLRPSSKYSCYIKETTLLRSKHYPARFQSLPCDFISD